MPAYLIGRVLVDEEERLGELVRQLRPVAADSTITADGSSHAGPTQERGAVQSKGNRRGIMPEGGPLAPIGRLDAVQQRLDAMIQAVQMVRSPAEQFYGSLSDDQRQRFVAMNASRNTARQLRPTTLGGSNLASICTRPEGGFTNLPVQHIEQLVGPNPQQQDALNELKRAEDAARALQARLFC